MRHQIKGGAEAEKVLCTWVCFASMLVDCEPRTAINFNLRLFASIWCNWVRRIFVRNIWFGLRVSHTATKCHKRITQVSQVPDCTFRSSCLSWRSQQFAFKLEASTVDPPQPMSKERFKRVSDYQQAAWSLKRATHPDTHTHTICMQQ